MELAGKGNKTESWKKEPFRVKEEQVHSSGEAVKYG